MKTAYSWGRFSTLAQGESGRDSQRRQIATAQAWCKRNGYTLSDQTFFDKGKSGFRGEHISEGGDLLKFIRLVEDGTIPKGVVLCIDSYDRFSRLPPSKALTLFLRVIDAGIKLVFSGSYEQRIIDAVLIDKEPNVLQFIIGEMIRSYNESKEKSRKISEALQSKKAAMKRGEIRPYNNMPKYFTFVPITKGRGRYTHNANTEIVKELVQGILTGKSLYEMADELNGRKVKTFRRGFEWAGTSIRQILKNRTLIGEYLGNKNYVPPVIDNDTFNRVQNILNRNARYSRGKKGEVTNIFKGICFCADCGKSTSVASQVCKGIHYRYLKCSVGGLGRNHTCKNKKLIRLFDMENEFFNHFLGKHPYQLINSDDQKETKQIRAQIERKQTCLSKLNSDISEAVALIGVVKADELKDKLIKMESERTNLKSELDKLTLKLSSIQDAPKQLQEVLFTITNVKVDSEAISIEVADRKGLNHEDVRQRLKNALVDAAMNQAKIIQGLADNTIREKVRMLLPNILGKVTIDTMKGQFYVYNRVGKLIYKSNPQTSLRNSSPRWKQSLKEWKGKKETKLERSGAK